MKKIDMACEHLEQALRLYEEGVAYCSALHLAAAADEILSRFLQKLGQTSVYAESVTSDVTVMNHLIGDPAEQITRDWVHHRITHAKNVLKHGELSNGWNVDFDPRQEAHDMLDSAVSNFYRLMSVLTPLHETDRIRRFNASLASGLGAGDL